MKISDNGVNLIKSFEGLSLKACKAVKTEKYWTIGYGHYGADVKQGQTITQAQALELLKSDIAVIEKSVAAYQTKYKWNQNQYDCITSFAYNLGPGQLKNLTANMTRTNAQISAALPSYCKSGGVRLNGLYKRRLKEQALFNTAVKKTVNYTTIAKEVIAGKWGNGSERKAKLEAAGYDYEKVQAAVNKLLKG